MLKTTSFLLVLILLTWSYAKEGEEPKKGKKTKSINLSELDRSNFGIEFDFSMFGKFYQIRKTCKPNTRGRSCYRICHPEDCLISGAADMRNATRRSIVVTTKVNCIIHLAKRSKKRGCFDRNKFNKVGRKLIEKYVYKYNDTLRSTLEPGFNVTNGSVNMPMSIDPREFTICSKFLTAQPFNTTGFTALLGFNMTSSYLQLRYPSTKLFQVLVSREEVALAFYSLGLSIYKTPYTLLPNKTTLICVSYKREPIIEVAMWLRQDGQVLEKLTPISYRPFPDLFNDSQKMTMIIGTLSVAGNNNGLQFSGQISSVRVMDTFLETRQQILPYLRCENDAFQILKSRVFAHIATDSWDLSKMELFGDAVLYNVTDKECGVECSRCKLECMTTKQNCTQQRTCASCEEQSCPDSHVSLATYNSRCVNSPLQPCSSTALVRCFKRGKVCRDLKRIKKCLDKIDLEECSQEMLKYANVNMPQSNRALRKLQKCTGWPTIMDRIIIRQYSGCAASCVIDNNNGHEVESWHEYPVRRRSDDKLCNYTLNYRTCIKERECAETRDTDGIPDQLLFSVVLRLGYFIQEGCVIPDSCQLLLQGKQAAEYLRRRKLVKINDKYRRLTSHAGMMSLLKVPWPTVKELRRCKKTD